MVCSVIACVPKCDFKRTFAGSSILVDEHNKKQHTQTKLVPLTITNENRPGFPTSYLLYYIL